MNNDFDKLSHVDCDCSSEEICKLFWNLDNFNDFDPEDEEDLYSYWEEKINN